MRVADLLLAIWIAAWIAMGVAVSGQLRDLRQLSDTVVQAGRATEEVGRTLSLLGDVPFVGEAGGDSRFELWLARRALERLPYEQLTGIVDRPWEPADERAARALAAAELRRYGLRRGSQ